MLIAHSTASTAGRLPYRIRMGNARAQSIYLQSTDEPRVLQQYVEERVFVPRHAFIVLYGWGCSLRQSSHLASSARRSKAGSTDVLW